MFGSSLASAAKTLPALPAPPPESEPAANTRVVATTLPASKSALDSEPILSHPVGGTSTPSAKTPVQVPGLELPRVAGALTIVICLIFLLRWAGKKLFQPNGDRRSTRAVQVLAKSPISPRQNILLLRVGRRVLVVGDSGTQMNPLSEITDPDEVASLIGQLRDDGPEFSSKAFGALFHRAKRDMSGDEPELPHENIDASETSESSTEDSAISDSHNEISGLMDRIRTLSTHFKSGQA